MERLRTRVRARAIIPVLVALLNRHQGRKKSGSEQKAPGSPPCNAALRWNRIDPPLCPLDTDVRQRHKCDAAFLRPIALPLFPDTYSIKYSIYDAAFSLELSPNNNGLIFAGRVSKRRYGRPRVLRAKSAWKLPPSLAGLRADNRSRSIITIRDPEERGDVEKRERERERDGGRLSFCVFNYRSPAGEESGMLIIGSSSSSNERVSLSLSCPPFLSIFAVSRALSSFSALARSLDDGD